MNRTLTVLVVGLGLVSVAWGQGKSASAAKGDTAEDAIKAEQQRCAENAKNDTAALQRNTSDDYIFTDLTGKVSDKAQMIQAFKSGKTHLEKYDCSDLKAHVYGNTAVVTGQFIASGMVAGQKADNRKVRFTRVWVKQGGQWKCVAVQQTEVK